MLLIFLVNLLMATYIHFSSQIKTIWFESQGPLLSLYMLIVC